MHSVRSRFYETVQRPSVRLSVPSIDSSSRGVRRVCCWVPRRQEILIDSRWRRSAANAGRVMLTAEHRFVLLSNDYIQRWTRVHFSSPNPTHTSHTYVKCTSVVLTKSEIFSDNILTVSWSIFFVTVLLPWLYHQCICWWHSGYIVYILLQCKWHLCPFIFIVK